MLNSKTIALDFDGTFTTMPGVFTYLVRYIQNNTPHRIVFVTSRHRTGKNEDINNAAKELGILVVFTNGKQKRDAFEADIWIDDLPETIVTEETMRTIEFLTKGGN